MKANGLTALIFNGNQRRRFEKEPVLQGIGDVPYAFIAMYIMKKPACRVIGWL